MPGSPFRIDKDIPPPRTRRVNRYPWADMQVGDSFFVPAEDGKERRKLSQSVSQAGSKFAKSMPLGDRVFAVRQVEGGVRAWRIE